MGGFLGTRWVEPKGANSEEGSKKSRGIVRTARSHSAGSPVAAQSMCPGALRLPSVTSHQTGSSDKPS